MVTPTMSVSVTVPIGALQQHNPHLQLTAALRSDSWGWFARGGSRRRRRPNHAGFLLPTLIAA